MNKKNPSFAYIALIYTVFRAYAYTIRFLSSFCIIGHF